MSIPQMARKCGVDDSENCPEIVPDGRALCTRKTICRLTIAWGIICFLHHVRQLIVRASSRMLILL